MQESPLSEIVEDKIEHQCYVRVRCEPTSFKASGGRGTRLHTRSRAEASDSGRPWTAVAHAEGPEGLMNLKQPFDNKPLAS